MTLSELREKRLRELFAITCIKVKRYNLESVKYGQWANNTEGLDAYTFYGLHRLYLSMAKDAWQLYANERDFIRGKIKLEDLC